jgi:hypothetical protein
VKHATTLLIALSASALAQTPPLTPAPRILQVFRESIRPGKESQYVRAEIEVAATLARLGFPHNYLTVSAVTGASDVWIFNGFDSYADVDQTGAAISSKPELLAAFDRHMASKDGLVIEGRSIFAHHRDDISSGRGLSGSRPRFFSIAVVSVRPGHQGEYAEIWRILRAGHEHAGITDIHLIYEVASGMPDPTFIVLTPAASLEDAGTSRLTHGRRFEEALGAAQSAKMRELMSSAILTSETNIFAIHPGMSLPAKEWMDADPDFWKPQR